MDWMSHLAWVSGRLVGEWPNSPHISLLSCLKNCSAQVMRGEEASSVHNYNYNNNDVHRTPFSDIERKKK